MAQFNRTIAGTDILVNINNNGKSNTVSELIAGDGWWFRFINKNVDTLYRVLSIEIDDEEKKFTVNYEYFYLFDDETPAAHFKNRFVITDDAEYDGFYLLSENGLMYPHMTVKAALNGLCLEVFNERIFNPYTGDLLL